MHFLTSLSQIVETGSVYSLGTQVLVCGGFNLLANKTKIHQISTLADSLISQIFLIQRNPSYLTFSDKSWFHMTKELLHLNIISRNCNIHINFTKFLIIDFRN